VRPFPLSAPLLGLLILGIAASARAQSLDPRSYVNTPVGMNFVVGGYNYSWGSVLVDPTLPIKDADITVQGPVLAYARAIDFWGLSGKANLVPAYSCLNGTGEVNGVQESRDVCGFGDLLANVSVNFIGAPALTLSEYPRYQQKLLVGASLAMVVPIGQYDPTKLVNIGAHRWAFRPQVGVSQVFGRLILELIASTTFFTTNGDFYNGLVRQQAPVYSGQLNAVYTFRSGIWGALGGTLYGGGRTTTNGVESPEFQENWRLGATLVFPIGRHNALKLFGSTGLYTRTGSDFNQLAATWIYRWGGRKFPKHAVDQPAPEPPPVPFTP